MSNYNIDRLEAGTKTTTVRGTRYARVVGLLPGEKGIVWLRGKPYSVHCRGAQTVYEAGGSTDLFIAQQVVLASEGVIDSRCFIYWQTKQWWSGKGKLWVYDLKPINNEQTQTRIQGQRISTERPE